MRKVCIIGGGASGMMAALSAASVGASVTLFERGDRIGNKIYATGNGRCNFSNLKLRDASNENICKYYRGTDPSFAAAVISSFGPEDTIRVFDEMGLFVRSRGDLLYPHSDQAASVVGAFERSLLRAGVDIRTGVKITGIKPDADRGFCVTLGLSDGSMTYEYYDACILCCGGRSYPKSGSDGFGYKLCRKLAIPLVKVTPALTKLICREEYIKMAAGARWQGRLTLYIDDAKAGEETGEIQFAEDAVSGIVAFQLSSLSARALLDGRSVSLGIDLCPDMSDEETDCFISLITERSSGSDLKSALSGYFNDRIADCIIDYMRETGADLRSAIRELAVKVSSVGGYDSAQTCSGGIDVASLDENMMVKALPGVYAAGELIDIDGLCGGFNLQFAFSTGYISGSAAGRSV